MTGSLRSTARSPLAVALMGVLTLVFLVLGVSTGGGRFQDMFKGINATDVVTSGKHTVSATTFKRMFEARKQELEQRYRQQFTADFLAEQGVDKDMVDRIAQEQAALEVLSRAGVTPADSLVDKFIKSIPVAQNPVTGAYDERRYTEWLANNNLTAREAQDQFRDNIAFSHFGAALQEGMPTPRLYASVAAMQLLENRDVSYFLMDQRAVPMPALPNDAQLQAFVNAHREQLKVPETRTFTMVRFSPTPLEATVSIDPAAVQQEFNFKKDSLSRAETRSFILIPVKTAAQGADAAARLQRGEDPAAVARAEGAVLQTFDDKPQSALPDARTAAAVFGLAPGAISQVQGGLGLAVVKLTKVTPGKVVTFAEARPQMEAAVRAKAARAKLQEIIDKFTDARDRGASLADAAKSVGAQVEVVGPVTADGINLMGQPVPGLDPKILKAAFAEPAGGSGTEVSGASTPGEQFALKVDSIVPPGLPPIEARRPILVQFYMRETLITALRAKADALIATAKSRGIEAAAAEVGGHVTHQVAMQRRGEQQYAQQLGGEFVAAIFSAKPGAVFASGANGGIAIAKLDAVRVPETAELARAVQVVGPQMSQLYLGDLDAAIRAYATARVKPNTNLDLARRAAGVTAETIAKLNAAAKPAKPGEAPAAQPRKGAPAA